MTIETTDYFTTRGFRETNPDALNEALRLVLDSMPTSLFEGVTTGLTAEEQAVLREGGLTLERTSGPDPMAETAIQYAAIVKRSLSSKEASRLLGLTHSRVRQMIANGSIYSFLIDGTRYVPDFQFDTKGKLIPNITQVNKALDPRMHPVEVYDWYHRPNVDLFLNDNIDATVSPLDWLRAGQDLQLLLLLANRL
jgi:hypothetical protein